MNIIIHDINKDNLFDVIKLTTNKDGIATVIEEFVASNALSIAQSKFYPQEQTRAIYNDDILIGFAMYGIDEDDNNLWLSRFMIDYQFQNKGLGKKAFLTLLHEIKMQYPAQSIYLSFEPDNDIAKKLYTACGFVDQNRILDGESVYKLTELK